MEIIWKSPEREEREGEQVELCFATRKRELRIDFYSCRLSCFALFMVTDFFVSIRLFVFCSGLSLSLSCNFLTNEISAFLEYVSRSDTLVSEFPSRHMTTCIFFYFPCETVKSARRVTLAENRREKAKSVGLNLHQCNFRAKLIRCTFHLSPEFQARMTGSPISTWMQGSKVSPFACKRLTVKMNLASHCSQLANPNVKPRQFQLLTMHIPSPAWSDNSLSLPFFSTVRYATPRACKHAVSKPGFKLHTCSYICSFLVLTCSERNNLAVCNRGKSCSTMHSSPVRLRRPIKPDLTLFFLPCFAAELLR